jgi:hypothetical protein
MLALGPSCVPPGAAAQPRMVSVVRIRLDSHKSMRPFKGIICDDISEFESYHLSHAVGSLSANMPARDVSGRSAAAYLSTGEAFGLFLLVHCILLS